MKKTLASLVMGGLMAVTASTLSAQELSLSQVGANCAQFFTPSPMTQGDVPLSITNTANMPHFIAWVNFAGNVNVLSSLSPGHTFNDISRPLHRYVIMDGNLNCTSGLTMGTTPGNFFIH